MESAPSPNGTPRPTVVVVGAGFGGLEAVRALDGAPVDVMLVDRNNYNKFQPLLYQIATAGLTSGNVTMPVRDLLRGQDNARFRRANVVDVDPEAGRIVAEGGATMAYDVLVLAVGAVTNYVDLEGVREYAFPLIVDTIPLNREAGPEVRRHYRRLEVMETTGVTHEFAGQDGRD